MPQQMQPQFQNQQQQPVYNGQGMPQQVQVYNGQGMPQQVQAQDPNQTQPYDVSTAAIQQQEPKQMD